MAEQHEDRFSFAVITMSDKGSRGERQDTSGAYLIERLTALGYEKAHYEVIPDNHATIVATLVKLVDEQRVSLIVTTGGTGVAPTDVTPEAMDAVFDREIPGMAELMRLESFKVTPRAALSRARAGIRKQSLIINLPGSLKAARENLEAVVPVLDHALEKIRGDESDCGVI
ncbi:MAG: molybdenum cofactor biosynthesis protein [Deltaproteobacteria bacterium]|nr:MAG: molybdenum cofactor biosynthesis protein [Deltaproteobacteria bacterium]